MPLSQLVPSWQGRPPHAHWEPLGGSNTAHAPAPPAAVLEPLVWVWPGPRDFSNPPGHSQDRGLGKLLSRAVHAVWGSQSLTRQALCGWEGAEGFQLCFQGPQGSGGHRNPTLSKREQVNEPSAQTWLRQSRPLKNASSKPHACPLSESKSELPLSSQQPATNSRVGIRCHKLARGTATRDCWGLWQGTDHLGL